MSNKSIESLVPNLGTAPLTPYKVMVALNAVLTELGLPPRPTQMGYNYVRNRLIPVVAPNRIDPKDARSWIVKYVTKVTGGTVEVAVPSEETTSDTTSAEAPKDAPKSEPVRSSSAPKPGQSTPSAKADTK